MISFLRRLLGQDRFEASVPRTEARDRHDALRSAERARALAKRLREEDLRREFEVRAAVIRRGRR